MEGSLLLGAVSGITGTVIITVLIYAVTVGGRKLDIPYLLGSYFVDIQNKTKVYTTGFILHFIAGAAWGAMYVLTLTTMRVNADWPAGILWGFAHGIFIGVAMSTLSEDHPHIGEGKTMDEPGILGRRWSLLMPYWILGLHVIFGVATLLIYQQLFHG